MGGRLRTQKVSTKLSRLTSNSTGVIELWWARVARRGQCSAPGSVCVHLELFWWSVVDPSLPIYSQFNMAFTVFNQKASGKCATGGGTGKAVNKCGRRVFSASAVTQLRIGLAKNKLKV